ncbi:unnamed protein product [Brassica rapa subsp. narinosa]
MDFLAAPTTHYRPCLRSGSIVKVSRFELPVISYFNMYYRTVVVYLSLWDEAAAMFRGLISSGDRTQTVMVVTTVNPKKFASLFRRLRIVEVLKHNNWYYVSCTGCSRKLDKSDQSPHCNRCVNLNATGVVKEMLQLTNLPAAALTLNEDSVTPSPPRLPTPRQLHLLKGKLAKQITSTEVEGLKDDTHPEGVKEEEVGNTHTRE